VSMNSDCQGAACPTVLLDDSPTSQDSFRHSLIAEAIAELVLSEKGGRAIALTGAWGTGKSTVVKLLEKELEKSSKPVKVVTFDAWAHQGDPLRRSFLEHAMRSLESWRPKNDSWERRIAILARRYSETVTQSRPNLTFLGALGAFALLISPAANQLFGLYSKNLDRTPIRVWALFVLGVLPLLLAIFVLG
jgi:predicted KAP-like P-loop ATPase